MCKKVLFIVGILILMLTILGVYSGDIFNAITAILWLPVTLLWDVPMVILPLTILAMIVLSIYGIVTKKYQKYYYWYRNLFILVVFGILAFQIESLFRSTSFFKLPEYINFFANFFLLLASIGYIAFVENKKDSRYYIVAGSLIVIYLIFKYICFVW